MRCGQSRAVLLISLSMGTVTAWNLCKDISHTAAMPLTHFITSLFCSLKKSYERTPESSDKCGPPPFLSPKAILQKQEIWNCNSAADKWYVTLWWIINESRRGSVLPSGRSVIQTVCWSRTRRMTGGETLAHFSSGCDQYSRNTIQSCRLFYKEHFYNARNVCSWSHM